MTQSYLGGAPHLDDRFATPNTVRQIHQLFRRWISYPVVVVRDPRDAYVSFYYHEFHYHARIRRAKVLEYFAHDASRPLTDDFAAYLQAKLLHRTQPSFFFREFVDSWLERPGICLVRYEDCLRDPAAELVRILCFLGKPVDGQRVAEAVEANLFQNYTREKSGVSRLPGEADPTQFARKGIAGDWRNHFNKRSCDLIEEFEGQSLRRLGYEADGLWIDGFLSAVSPGTRQACVD